MSNTCMSKKSYSSQVEAYAAAKMFARRWKQEPYYCDICGAWHLRTKREDGRKYGR